MSNLMDSSDRGERELFKRDRAFSLGDRRRTQKLELETRNSLIRLSRLIAALGDEMSLLPVSPTHHPNMIHGIPLAETHDAVSQCHKLHARNARHLDWPSQNKRAYPCKRSYIRSCERPARACTRKSNPWSNISMSDARGHALPYRYLVYASRCMPVNTLFGRASRCRSSSRLPGTRVPRSSLTSNSLCAFHSGSLGCCICMRLRRARCWRTLSIRSRVCSASVEHCSVLPSG